MTFFRYAQPPPPKTAVSNMHDRDMDSQDNGRFNILGTAIIYGGTALRKAFSITFLSASLIGRSLFVGIHLLPCVGQDEDYDSRFID